MEKLFTKGAPKKKKKEKKEERKEKRGKEGGQRKKEERQVNKHDEKGAIYVQDASSYICRDRASEFE